MASSFPFPTEEILHIILLNLDKYDLLNCRLVSQQWNQECLNVLKKSTHRQKLIRKRQVREFVEFSEQSHYTQFVLPFHLITAVNNDETTGITRISDHVENMIKMFGNECILELSVAFRTKAVNQDQIQALITLLTQIAQGLQVLNLSTAINTSQAEDVSSLQNVLAEMVNQDFVLRKLKKFSFKTYNNASTNLLFWFPLVQKCPNLEEFEFISECSRPDNNAGAGANTLNFPFPITQLHSMKLHHFTKELILQQLQQLKPNKQIQNPYINLRNLELTVDLIGQNMIQVEILQILSAFSNSLESLGLLFSKYESNVLFSISSFPILSKLKKLGIWFYNNVATDLKMFELNFESFPQLECMEMSSYVLLASDKNKTETDGENLSFLNVTSLTLEVSVRFAIFGFDHLHPHQFPQIKPYQEHFEKLHQIFPNVTKICILGKEEWGVKYALNGIVKSAGAEKITEIILKDCAHNYLEDILHLTQNPPNFILNNVLRNNPSRISIIKTQFKIMAGITESQIIEMEEKGSEGQRWTTIQEIRSTDCKNRLKNVKKFVLFKTPKSIDEDLSRRVVRETDKAMKKIDMDVMMEHLPCLQEIEISAYYFGNDYENRTKNVQNILANFPELIINVI